MASRAVCAAILVCWALLGSASPVCAGYGEPTPGIPDEHGILWDTPVYDPGSKRYFALVWAHDRKDVYLGTTYNTAAESASRLMFKGVRGRLAIVDSAEIHAFLLRTFHPDEPVLIGIRYLCGQQELQASDGRILPHSTFQAWATDWKQDIYACNSGPKNQDYMPIAYSSVKEGFRWIGKGLGKQFFSYFIEYSTGKP